MRFFQCSLLLLTLLLFNIGVWGQSNDSVGPLIQNDWTTFTWPYNAYLPESSSGVNGHIGNACGHTAIARLLHYYGFPVNGNGIIDFTNYFGYDWYCDLADLNLNYTAMPYQLNWDAPESEYHETAKLFLAAAAVGEKIEIGYRDAHLKLPGAMEKYFEFKSDALILNRWQTTKEDWVAVFKYELDHGRPILVIGRTEDSPPPWDPGGWQGHWWICDGYNENDEFYVNYSFGGIKGYYDIDNLGGIYTAYNTIIVGLEPNLNGKEIVITSPAMEEIFYNDEEFLINWKSKNVSKVNIAFSADGGYTWASIVQNIEASLESYIWVPREISSSKCLVKLTDAEDENIYMNSNIFTIEDNTTSIHDEENDITSEFILYQNFPNPFNPSTTIHFSIPKESYVELKVYDMLGKEVAVLLSRHQTIGNHQIEFDGSNLNSGVYFCVMKSGNYVSTIKLVLTK